MQTDKILYYEQDRIDPERTISGTNFDNGEIIYKKFMSTASKINLSKSYIKLTLSITNAAGNASLTLNDNLAPAFLACETLFKSSYYKINNVTVSSIGDYQAQICALNSRKNHSQGYRDSVLKDMNFGSVEFSERQKNVMQVSTGEQIEEKSKPGVQGSTIAVTIAGQIDGVNVDDAIVIGDTIEVYDVNDASILLYRGTIQQRDNANQFQSSVRPAIAVPASTNWVKITKVNNHRGARKIQLIFRPSLGIFQQDKWIVGHDFELSLYPHSNILYKKYFMESLVADKIPETDYDISIDNMIFYPCIAHVQKSVEQGEYDCNFMETRMQIQNITSQSDIDRTFIIDARSEYVTLALQDSRASGGNTLFPRTKFKVGKNDAGIDIDLDLKSYVILYDVYQFPRPQHDQESSANVDRIAQAYYENLLYSEQHEYLSDMESQSEYKKLGGYYHYKIPIRDRQSNPKLSIKTSFRNSFGNTVRPNILVFDHFKRSFKLTAKNGRIVHVEPTSMAR